MTKERGNGILEEFLVNDNGKSRQGKSLDSNFVQNTPALSCVSSTEGREYTGGEAFRVGVQKEVPAINDLQPE